jgi:hypothetical protein
VSFASIPVLQEIVKSFCTPRRRSRIAMRLSVLRFAVILVGLVTSTSSVAQVITYSGHDEKSGAQETGLPGESYAQEAYAGGFEHGVMSHQPEGCISGTILDQTGAVSIGANVHLIIGDQNSIREIQTGNNGQYVFTNVAPGSFRLTVSAAGFTIREFSAVLGPGEMYIVPPISLAVAPAMTEVHVRESPLSPVELADLQLREQERQRVFGIFPNFYVTYDSEPVPLSTKQKFRLAWKTTVDPFTFVGTAALAGVEQAADTFSGYGQGAQGYFKRFGASYTDAITSTYIGGAMLPSMLKQDPRYFYKGTGSTGSRLLYAIGSPFICKGDNRRWQFNYSSVAGVFSSAGISYLYYPESDRKGLFVQNSLIRFSELSFEGLLQEFVLRRLTPRLRKHGADQR